jgi:class 3 adenylate cyclase/tetratricopeptide (TPR) repeat protein
VQCPSCQQENPAAANFCLNCGTKLAKVCPQCQQVLPPEARFCFACGQPLKDGLTSSARRLASRQDLAERRQLTVMFCDLVGSTPLSQRLDPEELREVVRAYQEACAEVIHRFDGYIARYVGDALLVYFSYPQAHEDDAQRAVRAGLGIVAALPELNQQLQKIIGTQHVPPLQVRVGIHTGLVVVGELGGRDYREAMALGDAPNIAARLQGIATPDTVVISAATQRLVAGLFLCQDLGPQDLKGVSTPVLAYCVLSESGVQGRFEVAVRKGLTPLVGRDEELGLLRRRWERAKAGEGRAVLLSGEAGIGKSRLGQTLKEQVLSEGATRIEFRCSPYYQNSALYPIIEHMQRLLQFASHDSPQAKLSKLQQALMAYRFPQADTLALLAVLLSLPHPEGAPPLTLSPQRQKQKTQEALVAWLVEEAEKAAVYCAWEDLHWADPSTLEVLTLFLDQVPTTRLLALLTFRPEFSPPWGARSYLTPLTLRRLDRPQVETMVDNLTGGKTLPAEVVQQIVTKTDGVPLFIEELSKMVLEAGWLRAADDHYELIGSLPPLAIPATLQDSLMARLDRLAPVREIAQLGATLGREFSYELLQGVSPVDEETLQHGLRQLVEAELVYQRGVPPQATYFFKHALIQDTAYHSLLKSTRQQYHHKIAQVLEGRFSELTATQPELLAHHYTEAGLIAQAIPYWQKAGQRASQRSAHVEAISHLTKGLELLKTLPDTPTRMQQELTLQLALGDALFVGKGYTVPEAEKTYTRARELSQQLGETPQLFLALYGLWTFYFLRGEVRIAHERAEQCFSLAQSLQDRHLLSWAHTALGWTSYQMGELPSARTHAEQAVVLYDAQKYPLSTVTAGVRLDPRVSCLCYGTWALWLLGYPEQALRRSQEAVALAQGLSHPFSLAYALGGAATLHSLRREGSRAREWAAAVITLATEQRFPFWVAWGTMVQGWALAEQGQVHEGITRMRQMLAPFTFALLAEAHGKVGQVEEGLTVLTEALAVGDKTGMRVSEAELYRLKGELTLQQFQVSDFKFQADNPQSAIYNPQLDAEVCFLKAIDVARQQQAKSLELRVVMSLSRLWQQQGKKEEARRMLAEIYGWFTEGFDTRDLQEAKALLEELG